MRLSANYCREQSELDIICDDEGLDRLMRILTLLKRDGGHTHLMTPAWAGDELTEEKPPDGSELINHMRIVLLRKAP